MNTPICMSEEFWANSQLSIARHYGQILLGNYTYIIVNKEGKDIFECSDEADREGRDKAIPAGEPADLCRTDFVKFYRKLGREAFLQVLKDNQHASDKKLIEIYKETIKSKK